MSLNISVKGNSLRCHLIIVSWERGWRSALWDIGTFSYVISLPEKVVSSSILIVLLRGGFDSSSAGGTTVGLCNPCVQSAVVTPSFLLFNRACALVWGVLSRPQGHVLVTHRPHTHAFVRACVLARVTARLSECRVTPLPFLSTHHIYLHADTFVLWLLRILLLQF